MSKVVIILLGKLWRDVRQSGQCNQETQHRLETTHTVVDTFKLDSSLPSITFLFSCNKLQ